MATVADCIKFINEYPHPEKRETTLKERVEMVILTILFHAPAYMSLQDIRDLEQAALKKIGDINV
jgi:hypothetical protein